MRTEWVAKRQNDSIRTQLHYARQGVITEEMHYVARREKLAPELVRAEVARGRTGGAKDRLVDSGRAIDSLVLESGPAHGPSAGVLAGI